MRFFWVLILALFTACSSDEPAAITVPDSLVAEVKMVQLLADVHLLEATLQVEQPNLRTVSLMPGHIVAPPDPNLPLDTSNQFAYYDIFKKNGCSRDDYEKTMNWYTQNPEQLNLLYDKVLVELTERQTKEQIKRK
jgi:Domain of unknown function (DUF4296)